MDYKKLQNGSDIRGIALAGEEGQQPNLTKIECERLTAGFLLWLSEKTGKGAERLTVAIGRDSRLSGDSLMSAAIDALLAGGAQVLDCGLSSTPAMFMSTVLPEYACDGAIMITASHLPYTRNGFKYFNREGGLNKEDISTIITYAETGSALQSAPAKKQAVQTDLIGGYSAFLREKIKADVRHPINYEKPLTGLKITVDAGNGAGGFYARQVLAPLGADISGSLYLDPDGMFPNHAPNPEDPEAMRCLCKAVQDSRADFGLIFDTDVDRCAAVDGKGREISRNRIIGLAAALIAEEHPGTTVVTDSITSDQLTVFLTERLGLKHLRFKRGYKNVINEAKRLCMAGTETQLAIETSGHAALAENYFLDDGAYLATKIVIKAARLALEGKAIDCLIAEMKEPREAVETRLLLPAQQDVATFGEEVIEALRLYVQEQPGMSVVTPNYEGIRVVFDAGNGDGWCLLRKSLHDPILPLNIESNAAGGCEVIRARLRPLLTERFGLVL